MWCALWVLLGVTYALSNGLHAPAEAGKAAETISIGDAIGVYVGAPLAAWLGIRLVVGRVVHRPAT
jgi:predicted MFS family arabinose efflux permease